MKTAELFDHAASSAPLAPTHPAMLYPGRLRQEMADSFRADAASKGLELKTEPYPDWHDVVIDDSLVRQIVGLVLSDAIEHTSAGWVRLTVTPPDGEHWGIIVEGTGDGAASPQADGVFLADLSARNGADHPGAEPALSACQELIARLDGEITLRHLARNGTHCKIRLPVMVRHSFA